MKYSLHWRLVTTPISPEKQTREQFQLHLNHLFTTNSTLVQQLFFVLQRWQTTIRCRNSRIFEISRHMRIQLSQTEWHIQRGYTGSKYNRSKLARFGHVFDAEIPGRCYRSVTRSIPLSVFELLFRTVVR